MGHALTTASLDAAGIGAFFRPRTERETIAMVASAVPKAIVCLLSALSVHEIGTQLPHEVWIALDRKARKPRRVPAKLRIVRFSGVMLTYGVIRIPMQGVRVSITSPSDRG